MEPRAKTYAVIARPKGRGKRDLQRSYNEIVGLWREELAKLKANPEYDGDGYNNQEWRIMERMRKELGYDHEEDNRAMDYCEKATSEEAVAYTLRYIMPKFRKAYGLK